MPDTAPSPEPKQSWYRRFYQRVEALSATRYALAALLIVSVLDGSVFPVPPFALLIPMVLAHPKRWWWLAALGTVASLGGGLIGYGLGSAAHAWVEQHLHINVDAPLNVDWNLLHFHIHSTVRQLLNDQFWILALLCSVLPTPFKVVAIGSGIVGVSLGRFMLAAVIGRTVRFFVIAGLMASAGLPARKWLRM